MSEEKKILRKRMKKIMEEPDPIYRKNADLMISGHILSSDLYRNANTIFTFITMLNEIDMRPIIRDALDKGKVVCGPKCYKDRRMEARRFRGLEDIVNGFLDIPEPRDTCPVISKEDIDLAFVPCLAADSDGNRVGYGAGYYDRYLKTFNGDIIIFCREKQLLDKMPVEPHDIPARFYVTEKGLFTAAGQAPDA